MPAIGIRPTWAAGLVALTLSLLATGCDNLAQFEARDRESSASRQSDLSLASQKGQSQGTRPTGVLTAHYIDVGQGDATLLMGPDFTILIDAGRHDRRDVVAYLQAAGVKSLDLLIGTHPHADHIGQFPQVLDAFPVTEVWMSGDAATSRTFERAIDAILNSEAGYHEPRAGESIELGSARIEVINPEKLTGDLHAGCIGVRIVFGDVAFMFTGDAEQPTEREIVARGHNLKAQILKLGHHGSRTSTIPEFLAAVEPEVAIYSAGLDNSYGHPHDVVLDRVIQSGAALYGTIEQGTIRVISDGSTYRVETERENPIRGPPAGGSASPQGSAIAVNINSAGRDELTRIVHIGPERADQVIQMRPFRTLRDLSRVPGLSDARVAEIEQQGLAVVK